jgi:hypothetical protein
VKPTELVDLLRAFYQDKSALRQRHVDAARRVGDYNFNNTYQYIISREDVQLSWLRDAIAELGGAAPDDAPGRPVEARGKPDRVQASLVQEDRDGAQTFVDRWRDKVEKVTNARNRIMLRVILGETLEARRFFDQMVSGREDLLGRRADGAGTPGWVLPTRWVGGQ